MKSALITGANRGIGLETAVQLGKLGFHVILGTRDGTKGEDAVNKVKLRGVTSVDFVQLDVTSEESVKQAVIVVQKKCNGVLDVLINNAGVYHNGCSLGTTVDLNAVRESMETNLIGVMRVTNYFLDMIKRSSAGRIVNVSSILGSIGSHVATLSKAPYCVSKTALNMYTVNLAEALKGTPVKVNAAHPGWVKTDMGGAEAALDVVEGTETIMYLATLPCDGPTGGLFFKKDPLPW